MNSLRYILMLGVCLLALVSAQITFSRDWTGGKRAAPHVPRLALDCSQFTRLCRHFIVELKQAFSSEMGKNQEEIEKPILYDDE
ncbi:uncharacterized protein LOC115443027 isoform X2 [Manduca sexta]|uniref:uncharacterized protein LOC115443027 isoform X2 n=1 Tax=Manduca sexta TaxID=7130 RepID=UPI0018909BC2|nr:uncharacterized protein LOC115443027 isoform X2 [Manduca sexta]